MKHQKRGFIDLGSNSIRFVIYKMTKKGNVKEELNIKRTARLSLHVGEDKNITAKGIDKVIKSLHYFKKIAHFHQVDHVQCFATAVVREAPNQGYVIKKVKKSLNLDIEVLTEFEEAYYGFIGAIGPTSIPEGVTIDIGGGSTEVTLFKNRKLKHAHSFPFGAVTLTKRFVSGKKPTKKEMAQLATYLSEQFSELPWLKNAELPVIGIGGTARNLSKVFNKNNLTTSSRKKLNQADIQLTSDYLQSFSLRKRKKVAGLSKERADIIIPGIEAIFQLMEIVEAPSFVASKQGLREGICYSELLEEIIKAR